MAEPAPHPKRFQLDYDPMAIPAKLRALPHDLAQAVLALFEGLEVEPWPGKALLRVRPYKDNDIENAFTTVVQPDCMIIFQVFEDLRMIRILDIIWT